MNLHWVDPLADGRWGDMVSRHAQASVFHKRGWLDALRRTYGYEVRALTSSNPEKPLSDALVFCRIASWITGRRWVSLPFSDHCDPLVSGEEGLATLIEGVARGEAEQNFGFGELRPSRPFRDCPQGLSKSARYYRHSIDISAGLDQIFQRLHRDSIQRKIQRAEREELTYESGNSEELVGTFYKLTILTRRRHGLLPQPREWFANLADCLRGDLRIRVARRGRKPIAAMLAIRHGRTVVYKYGCSDQQFHQMGGMPFLFWKLIEESRSEGVECVDLGRSDCDQEGLITFKERLGAARSEMFYYQSATAGGKRYVHLGGLRRLLPLMPDRMLAAGGSFLYKHLG